MTVSDPLLAFRDRFPILKRSNYLINNSLGARHHRRYYFS